MKSNIIARGDSSFSSNLLAIADFAGDRLFTLYQRIYDALHLKPPAGGQGRQPAKLMFFQTQHEGVIGWVRVSLSITVLGSIWADVLCRARQRSKCTSHWAR